MKGERKRLTEKELKQLQRVRAEEEAKSRSESKQRHQTIERLWHELKEESERVKELAKDDDIVGTLLELVGLQRDEISYMRSDHRLYQWAKTHAPDEVAAIRKKFDRVVSALLKRGNKLTPTQAYERRTRSTPPDDEIGLIEYEFGGRAQARAFLRYDPTCLDGVLMGYGVNMEYLESLFGMERHRFPKGLNIRDGRKALYSALAVVKIMDTLLGERLLERKPQARGGSERKLWPREPDSRKPVLMGIANRALGYSRYKGIQAAFMAVACRHLAIGYPNEQLPEGWEELARLGRHFLD